jgi:hypothetical protein
MNMERVPAVVAQLRIDRNADWEIDYWTRKLNVSRAELERALDAAGTSIIDVVALICRQGSPTVHRPPT